MSANTPAELNRRVPDEYAGDLPPNYYCRGWNGKRQKYCRARAGKGTDHPGRGRCKHHGGSTPIKSGRYSTIERPRIRELIKEFEEDPDPLDLRPELDALRALFQDYVERYDEFAEALLAWHNSWESEDRPKKPRQIMDVATAHKVLDTIAKTVGRIEKIRSDAAISRQDLLRIINEMARVVDARVVDDAIKQKIRDDWLRIRLA